MMKSIFAKIFSGYLFIAFGLSALILVFSFNTIKSHYIEALKEDLMRTAAVLKLRVIPLIEEKRFNEIDALAKKLGTEIQVRITIIMPDGTVVADSEKQPSSMENHKTRPEIIEALNRKAGSSLRFSTTINEDMLYVAVPILKDSETASIEGFVRVSLHLKDINLLLGKLKTKILQTAFIIIAISAIGAVFLAKNLAKPIKELSAASRRVAEGDFDVRVLLRNRDEIYELANNFNYMTEKTRSLFRELSLQKEELNGIISSLQEGLLLLNREGKIILCNESFKIISQEKDIEGKLYWEVFRNPDFNELIDSVWKKMTSSIKEVEQNSRRYLCSAAPVKAKDEVVAIFHDITELANLEKVKKDFVVNVSHELRTPLTAIKGYVETIEDEIDENSRQYLDVIKRNTDRLINIVNDQLLLSELEETGIGLKTEKVNLKTFTENTLQAIIHKAEGKGLTIQVNARGASPEITADPFKLEQMLINLVDNAIKYTDKGGITITLGQDDSQATIEVEDTGIGIPEEDIPRIFERFYVVDKSRSKKAGGTGLGLSIVKHIVLLHNGKINVESKAGQGTKFSISLPA